MSPGAAGRGRPRGRGTGGVLARVRSAVSALPSLPPVRREWVAALAVGLAALALLLVFAGQPLLYAAKTAAVTPSHEDIRATGEQTRTDGALVLPEWASSLNLTEPVTLDIKLGDLAAAQADLDAYLRSGRSLSGLVVRLDMSATDVAAFQRNNTANMAALQQLLNQSEEFGRLGTLELQYRDAGDAAMLKSVQLQGEGLRAAVQQNYQSYAARQAAVVNISRQYGLNTSAYEQSVLDFAAIVKALEGRQDERAASVPEAIREIQRAAESAGSLPPITFEVVPDTGAYGDVLSLRGTVRAPAGTEVTVYSDGRPLAGVVSGADGRFAFPYRIDRVDAGRHAAYASAGPALSDERNFTVLKRNTTVDLAAALVSVNGSWTAVCTGNLSTVDGVPVRDALVGIYVDRSSWANGYTGADGAYAINATYLEPGRHNLTARYAAADGRPLNASVSAPVELQVPSVLDWLAPLLYLLGLGGAGLGAVLYLRRRRALPSPPAGRRTGPPPEPVVELPPAPTVEEAASAAAVLEAGVDGREAVTRLYRRLVRELDLRHPGELLLSFTPREIAARFAAGPAGEPLSRLVRVHERVRYAGLEPTEEDIRVVHEAFIHVISESGSH
ncbi:MAG: DUF4129 domain-containing protein [Methanospirillum sp.]